MLTLKAAMPAIQAEEDLRQYGERAFDEKTLATLADLAYGDKDATNAIILAQRQRILRESRT